MLAKRVTSTFYCCVRSSIFISTDGHVYYCGQHHPNIQKEIAICPKQIPSLTSICAINCYSEHTVCLDIEGRVFTFGDNSYGQLGVGKDKDTLPFSKEIMKVFLPPCKEVSCGSQFTVCITVDGDVYSFGNNTYGQLGIWF